MTPVTPPPSVTRAHLMHLLWLVNHAAPADLARFSPSVRVWVGELQAATIVPCRQTPPFDLSTLFLPDAGKEPFA